MPETRPRVRLRRDRLPLVQPPQLDRSQQAVVEHRGRPLRVLGAAGTGKTTVVVEAVAARVAAGLNPAEVLVLAPTRLAAARLREQITARLVRTMQQPPARTPQSFAFGIVQLAASRRGGSAPRLITGPEQDLVLHELLAGHAAGFGAIPRWPQDLALAIGTRGFRGELRDLLMRATERGISPAELARLGRAEKRPEWVAAAKVYAEYQDVTGLGAPGGYDPAAITGAAVAELNDPQLLTEIKAQTRFLVMDDAHEATAAVADLIAQVSGTEVLLTGDPDAVTQGFRGADPSLILTGECLILESCWRQGEHLRAATRAVSQRIGALGGGRQRQARAAASLPGQVRVQIARTSAAETALIADFLRREHLLHGRDWGQLAVIVRGGTRSAQLRRGLISAGVPVASPLAEVPVRDEPAAVPLLDAFEVALAVVAQREHPLSPERAESLLLSPLGGADTMGVRRIRRALRSQEFAAECDPDQMIAASAELLVTAILDPARLGAIDPGIAAPARRVAGIIAAGVAAAGKSEATAETLLWALWSASGLAQPWRRTALAGGPAGARADRDLDAVVALFDSAARFVDRLPSAGPQNFIDYLRGQEVPADTLAERGVSASAVTVLTPAAAAGQEWAAVAVAGVQEGVWPDLRLRGSLLGSEELVDVLTGRDGSNRAALRAIRDDETRLFQVAMSRASARLLVTAVRNEQEQPSGFLDLIDPPPTEPNASWDEHGQRRITEPPLPLSLAGVVAQLRQRVCVSPPDTAAAVQLARLARAGVPGADPNDWAGLAELSDDRPLASDHPVRVSPSSVEKFDRCALRWLLQQAGGTATDSSAQSLGLLVHELAAEFPQASLAELLAQLQARLVVLGLKPGWVGDMGRKQAERAVRKLAQYIADNPKELVGTELEVSVLLELPQVQVHLRGRVDRVEKDDDGLHIIDFKTGGSAPRKEQIVEHPQLVSYQLAVQAGAFLVQAPGAPAAGAALVQLGTKTINHGVQRQAALAPDGGMARELIARVAKGMSQANFPATINELCDHCPVRTSCPAQPEGRSIVE